MVLSQEDYSFEGSSFSAEFSFVVSSPEPQSPSSFTSSSTPISSSSSLKLTPPPCVQISCVHLRSQSYEDDSTMPIPHESDGTVILSSDESSSE